MLIIGVIKMYDPEVNRRREARLKARRPIRDALIKLGAEECNDELILAINKPLNIKAYGIIWPYKGKIYVRWSNLGSSYAEKLINEVLNLTPGSLSAGNALRRELVRGVIRNQISVEQFYKTVLQK